MKVLDPGHVFQLDLLDGNEGDGLVLRFVKREGPGYPGNYGHYPGTNIQEVLRSLISRVTYLNHQRHAPENGFILRNLRESLYLLEQRAARNHDRPWPPHTSSVDHIESYPTCKKCGHIGCKGECH